MYDKIKIMKRLSENDLNILDNSLDWNKEINNSGEIIKCKYRLKNLYININLIDRSININGSIAKYYKGNNTEVLSIEETKKAIEQLEQSLNIDLKEANVYTLEIGIILEMEQPCMIYLNMLGDKSRFEKTTIGNYTVRYSLKGNKRAFTFYDKEQEQGKALPEQYRGKNLLRIELQFNNKLNSQLKKIIGKKLLLSDLWNKEIYEKLKELLIKEYNSIIKVNTDLLTGNIKSKADLNKYAYSISQETIIKNLELSKPNMKKRTYYNYKATVRKAVKKQTKSDTLKELDKKIVEALEYIN